MTDRVLPASESLNAPVLRFTPSDEELISYLKKKIQGKPLVLNAIEEVDVYKHDDPSVLPDQSSLKAHHQEGYFFTSLEKYGEKRATNKGYWHQSGVDKEVKRRGDGHVIGKVKRLVFNTGRPPNNQPTNWVMHEYHLVDNDGHGYMTDSYVLCRLSNNSGNINEKIQQESHSRRKNLFDLNDPKTVDQACLLPCVLNKEAPLPLIQYKRKRQIDSFGSYDDNSSQTTHHHDSTPSVATMLEESEPEPVDTAMVPTRRRSSRY